MIERSEAFHDAIARLIDTPSRSEGELKLPSTNLAARGEALLFIEGALYANDWIIDAWRVLEDKEPNRITEAAKDMLVHLINCIGEQARHEALRRFPSVPEPSEREIALGKHGKLGYD